MGKELSFKTWFESNLFIEDWRNYKLDSNPEENDPKSTFGRPEMENPISIFDIEYMHDIMMERRLGPYEAKSKFVNEIHWGDTSGAVKMIINPQYGVYLEKLGKTLQGDPVWYTKKFYQINREGYGSFEPIVTETLCDELQRIYDTPADSPQNEIEDFQGLVIHVASAMKKVMRPIFIFEQIRKVNDNRYIICLTLRGQGTGAPDNHQVFRNLFEVVFYPDKGVIRAFDSSAEHHVGKNMSPILQPMHANFYFFPSQTRDEIADAMAGIMRFY